MTAPRTQRAAGAPIYRTMQVAEGAKRVFGVVAGAHVCSRNDKQDTFSHGFGPLGRSRLRKLCARGAPDAAASASVAASSLPSCFFDRGTRPRRAAGRQRGAARRRHCVAIHRRVAPHVFVRGTCRLLPNRATGSQNGLLAMRREDGRRPHLSLRQTTRTEVARMREVPPRLFGPRVA